MFAAGCLTFTKAGSSGVLPSLLAKQFPVATRAVGIAFSYAVSVTVFGGIAPFITAWLIAQTGDPLSHSFYLTQPLSSASSPLWRFNIASLVSRLGGNSARQLDSGCPMLICVSGALRRCAGRAGGASLGMASCPRI
jgi:hypothetical protein